MNPKTAIEYPIYQDSKTGRCYTVADGRTIDDEGMKLLMGSFGNGAGKARRAIKARVCDTQRSLLAVGELVDGESGVFFSKSGSCIMDKQTARAAQQVIKRSGKPVVPLQRRNGVFECDMKLDSFNEKMQNSLKRAQGFP